MAQLEWTIGDLARETGVPVSTLRYYERIKLLPSPPRHKGRRVYGEDSVRRLRFILLLRQAGFHLREIRPLAMKIDEAQTFAGIWTEYANRRRAEVRAEIKSRRAIEKYLARAAACGCDKPLQCDLLAG
jgi:MerR family mercuric resistance operon transcriptional regulator